MHPVDAANLAFYEHLAERFSATRQRPWPGWSRIVLPPVDRLRVLDVGCGNGRLYATLAARAKGALDYVGIDFSPALLERAQRSAACKARPEDTLRWIERDIHDLPNSLGRFDFIFVFGVLHHIAEHERRRALLQRLATHLCRDSGSLWLTVWRFGQDPRFHHRGRASPLDGPLEQGAVWLDFEGQGRRYCVALDEAEIPALAKDCGLEERLRFFSDGKSARLNLYLVYGHPRPLAG